MKTSFKEIHIGNLIQKCVEERGEDMDRICTFLNRTEAEVNMMFTSSTIDTDSLLRWSKLLQYDFFRIYTQHLILFSPFSKVENTSEKLSSGSLPKFRKHIYTREIIDFILELITSGEKTKAQVIDDYKIPKTTLYKWMKKYQN